ncbi:trypsin-like peptidase domain-containing protein [Candidatus Saccharibacteria bacterium]|nr:trypsin-like peptidase domain-containing protein [Candidatus Saccharibacteria bacterium]
MEKDGQKSKNNESSNYAVFSTHSASLIKRPKTPNLNFQNGRKKIAFLILPLACLLMGVGGGLIGASIYNKDYSRAVSTEAKQRFISNESELISDIAKNVGQAVVSINVKSQVNSRDVFGFSQPSSQESAGTGFIITLDGVIMTNRHVVPAASSSVSVTLADGARFDNVEVIGRTSESSSLDIAFLKIKDLKGKKLTKISIGNSTKVKVGDKVIAIGNALGQFQNTVTSGIISGYGRDVTAGDGTGNASRLDDLFQTDAAINEGNSGGPLVNINGEVIGVNTAIAGGAQNIGFAIPIDDTKGLISSVLETGKLRQPYLGVRYVSLTDDIAFQYSLNIKRGAYIVPSTEGGPSILIGSPAEKAGLREKDVITKINNTSIDDKTSLTGVLGKFKVGSKVNLQVWRDGKYLSVPIVLESVPEN